MDKNEDLNSESEMDGSYVKSRSLQKFIKNAVQERLEETTYRRFLKIDPSHYKLLNDQASFYHEVNLSEYHKKLKGEQSEIKSKTVPFFVIMMSCL